jgi:heme-degrading monooxygenase HmoA
LARAPAGAIIRRARQAPAGVSNKLAKENGMIGVLVRFPLADAFNEERLRQIAAAARTRFEGMPGLRSKAFTVDADHHEALNFYVWESEEAARAFFSPELIERVTGLYGVRPSVQFAPVAALVENPPSGDA